MKKKNRKQSLVELIPVLSLLQVNFFGQVGFDSTAIGR